MRCSLRRLDTWVLSFYTLALAIFSGMMVVTAINPKWVEPQRWLEETLSVPRGRMVLGMVGALFFLASVRLIVAAWMRRAGGQPVVHQLDLGDVRISLDAVENLVRKIAGSVKGVRDVKAMVTHKKDGLHAVLSGTISPEVSIPEISEEIQSAVRQYVKRVVGVELTEVRLDVENIANEGRRGRLD